MPRAASWTDEPRRLHVKLSRLDMARLNLARRYVGGLRDGAPFATAAIRYALAQLERELRARQVEPRPSSPRR